MPRSSHRCEPRTSLSATKPIPTWCSVHRMRPEEMRRAFSDLIIQSYSPEEIEALSWTVVSAMLPEHDDGRQVMDDDPATLSDWNYESPKPPKTSLIRKPTPPAIMPPPPWPANFSDPENYDPDE